MTSWNTHNYRPTLKIYWIIRRLLCIYDSIRYLLVCNSIAIINYMLLDIVICNMFIFHITIFECFSSFRCDPLRPINSPQVYNVGQYMYIKASCSDIIRGVQVRFPIGCSLTDEDLRILTVRLSRYRRQWAVVSYVCDDT